MKKKFLFVFIALSLVCTATVSAQLFRQREDRNDRARTFTLFVRSDVEGDVYVDGRRAGRTNQRIKLKPGRYQLRVSSDGYKDFDSSFVLKRDMEIRANLEPAIAKLTLVIPRDNLSEARNPLRQIILIVDGVVQRGHNIEISAGSHEIGIGSGGLVFYQRVNIRAGKRYRISPRFSIDVDD
jgi:hypothetical protein